MAKTDPVVHEARYIGADNTIRTTNEFWFHDKGIVIGIDKYNATLIPWQRIVDVTTVRTHLM